MDSKILRQWKKDNPISDNACYKEMADNQMELVFNHLNYQLSNMIQEFNGTKTNVGIVEAMVCSTHVSKSILLPVYCLEENGIKLVFRCNFHGWCLKIFTPDGYSTNQIPNYLLQAQEQGFYEGMDEMNDFEYKAAFSSVEKMFAFIWWYMSEGINKGDEA
jgi:hypothetical protein